MKDFFQNGLYLNDDEGVYYSEINGVRVALLGSLVFQIKGTTILRNFVKARVVEEELGESTVGEDPIESGVFNARVKVKYLLEGSSKMVDGSNVIVGTEDEVKHIYAERMKAKVVIK